MADRSRLLRIEKIASDASQRAPTGGAIDSPIISNPNVTGGTFANPTVTNPNIAGGALTSPSITSPSITGATLVSPSVLGPLTTAEDTTETITGQTTPGSHIGVVLASFPLPGTAPAPDANGVLDLDVDIIMVSTTTVDAARFKMSWQWSARDGTPTAMGALLTSLSVGTNAGAPPAGWTATLALDIGSTHAQVKVDGDAALTVDCKVSVRVGYTT